MGIAKAKFILREDVRALAVTKHLDEARAGTETQDLQTRGLWSEVCGLWSGWVSLELIGYNWAQGFVGLKPYQ